MPTKAPYIWLGPGWYPWLEFGPDNPDATVAAIRERVVSELGGRFEEYHPNDPVEGTQYYSIFVGKTWLLLDSKDGRVPRIGADWRDIPLTSSAIGALERQASRRTDLLGQPPDRKDYVFPSGVDGRVPMRPDHFTNRWTAARGSSPITLLHLRHYAATVMLDAGESYRTVADILGNSEATLRLHYDGRTDVGVEHPRVGAVAVDEPEFPGLGCALAARVRQRRAVR